MLYPIRSGDVVYRRRPLQQPFQTGPIAEVLDPALNPDLAEGSLIAGGAYRSDDLVSQVSQPTAEVQPGETGCSGHDDPAHLATSRAIMWSGGEQGRRPSCRASWHPCALSGMELSEVEWKGGPLVASAISRPAGRAVQYRVEARPRKRYDTGIQSYDAADVRFRSSAGRERRRAYRSS